MRDFGARGDGQTDDTAAFQKALDAVGQAVRGVVYAPRGNYCFAGHIKVPGAVTLKVGTHNTGTVRVANCALGGIGRTHQENIL